VEKRHARLGQRGQSFEQRLLRHVAVEHGVLT
jgi:hypothetical protein